MTEYALFRRHFCLRWYEKLDHTYYSILSTVSAAFIIAITSIASLDYDSLQQNANSVILDKYKRMVAEFQVQLEEESPAGDETEESEMPLSGPLTNRISNPASRAAERERLIDDISRESVFQGGAAYGDLPIGGDFSLEELLQGEDFLELNWQSPTANESSRILRSPDRRRNYEAAEMDDRLKEPFEYEIARQGKIEIDLTTELITEPRTRAGYRDPEEISRVVYHNQPQIEYCFMKASRRQANFRGYVKVQFKISYKGYVIPESIVILDSSINDREVLQCIKNYIRTWRGFEPLNESMGIARVVQKFVFN